MASFEDDFFFPESCHFCWTGTESTGAEKEATNFNIERMMNKQHGVQFDPTNKACIRFLKLAFYFLGSVGSLLGVVKE